jgi:release factor glutamine methyltransferase
MTVQKTRQALNRYFSEHGLASPARETMHIISAVLNRSINQLYADPDQIVDRLSLSRIWAMAKRRAAHEPMAYLTGQAVFFNLDFDIGPGVLVPRPDTEVLVETACKLLEKHILPARTTDKTPVALLDTCAGSGCVGISLALWLNERKYPWTLYLVDRDKQAIKWAKKNIARHLAGQPVRLFQSDLFPKESDMVFDLIVANPPYIPSGDIDELMPEVSRFEPRVALDGGPDGLQVFRSLIDRAPAFLNAHGWLVLEQGFDQNEAVVQLLEKHHYAPVIPAVYDLALHPRVCAGRRPRT